MDKRIIFIGCKSMGFECLEFLLSNYAKNLVAIYTLDEDLKDRTAGYKDFHLLLKKNRKQAFFVKDINSDENISQIQSLKPDLIIQVGWSQVIKDKLLAIPKLGCIGFHSSLLPKNRGGSPVNWALVRGEKKWGVTLFYVEPGVDNGDIIDQRKFEINLEDTCKTVYEKSTRLMVKMLRDNLSLLFKGIAPRKPQKESEATYNKRRQPKDGLINWNSSAITLYNWVRAQTHPYPGAFTYLGKDKIFIWKVRLGKAGNTDAENKEKLRTGDIKVMKKKKEVWVKTIDSFLIIEKLQKEDSKEIKAYNFFTANSNYQRFSNEGI